MNIQNLHELFWSFKSIMFIYLHTYTYVCIPSLHMLSSAKSLLPLRTHGCKKDTVYTPSTHVCGYLLHTHTHVPAATRKSPYNKLPFHHSLCPLHSCPSIKQRKMWAACVHTAQTHCNGCKSEAGTLCWCSHYGSHYRGLVSCVCRVCPVGNKGNRARAESSARRKVRKKPKQRMAGSVRSCTCVMGCRLKLIPIQCLLSIFGCLSHERITSNKNWPNWMHAIHKLWRNWMVSLIPRFTFMGQTTWNQQYKSHNAPLLKGSL